MSSTKQTENRITAHCFACAWNSLPYVRRHAAENAADKHNAVYHAHRPNVIKMEVR